MTQKTLIIGFSIFAHLGLAIGLGEIDVRQLHAATAIQIAETTKPPPPKTEPVRAEPEPPKPEKKQPIAARAAAPAPEPPKSSPEPAALDAALPDFGLSLSGGVGGNGMALPAAGSGGPKPAPVARSLVPAPTPAPSGCGEKPSKPKPKSVPQPVYTAEARAAGIEGKVRVELTVDQTGTVVSVRVLQGLGHGLDEAAVLAARQAQFEPALECGKPTRATFTISMRFTAS